MWKGGSDQFLAAGLGGWVGGWGLCQLRAAGSSAKAQALPMPCTRCLQVYQTFMVYKCSREAAVLRQNGTRLASTPDNAQMRALIYYQNTSDVWQVRWQAVGGSSAW